MEAVLATPAFDVTRLVGSVVISLVALVVFPVAMGLLFRLGWRMADRLLAPVAPCEREPHADPPQSEIRPSAVSSGPNGNSKSEMAAPLVRTGPGGDFSQDLDLEDLDGGARPSAD
jgi:hypothetical protein